jgi:hypothetical protein
MARAQKSWPAIRVAALSAILVDQLAASWGIVRPDGCVAALHGSDLFCDQALQEHGRHLQVRIHEVAFPVQLATSGGHSTREIIGCTLCPIHMPLAPAADGRPAEGLHSTSSDTWVGWDASLRIRCGGSASAARASLLLPRPTFVGSPFVDSFNGENMPLAAGKISAACCSQPSKDRNRLSETVLLRRSSAILL